MQMKSTDHHARHASCITPPFDHYWDYAEMDAALTAIAAACPHLCTRHEIGRSHQGRAIILMEITNGATGSGTTKPGYYIDGCIHTEELAAPMVPLHTIHALCTRYGDDPDITALLDTPVVYIVPG